MIIPLDVKCTICPKTFCCGKCRRKHESTAHTAELAIRAKCPICNGRPYILEKIVGDTELFEHLMVKHLPLVCNKCNKIFYHRSELTPATKCDCREKQQKPVTAVPSTDEENKENTVDNDCSRYAANKLKLTLDDEVNEILTPLSKWNLKWRRKSTEFHTNVSSIKRTSSLLSSLNKTAANQSSHSDHHQANSAGPKAKKLTRSTSTPMHQMMLVHKSVTFDSLLVSSCQMSSIACSVGSESESGSSAASSTSSPEKPPKVVVPKSRPRVPLGLTPLRLQLMSKSVQRAMAAHQGKYQQYQKANIQRKMMFDSTSSSGNASHVSPLDLRTTPVMRRTQSESVIREQDISQLVSHEIDSDLAIPLDESPALVLPVKVVSFAAQTRRRSSDLVQHLTLLPESDQSELSTSNQPSGNSDIYVTCEDFEASAGQMQKSTSLEVLHHVTPRPMGGFMKKAISFATPDQMSLRSNHEDSHDFWYTPAQDSWLRSRSCSTLVNRSSPEQSPTSLLASSGDYDSSSDEVFYANPQDVEEPRAKPTGRLWNIMTSVLRLASGSAPNFQEDSKKSKNSEQPPKTIVQRAASFAGFFRSSSNGNSAEEASPAKRKRTQSHNGLQQQQQQQPMNANANSPKAKRYKSRIRGRQPINRLRDSLC